MDLGSGRSLLDQGRLEPVAFADGAFAPRIHVEEEGYEEETGYETEWDESARVKRARAREQRRSR